MRSMAKELGCFYLNINQIVKEGIRYHSYTLGKDHLIFDELKERHNEKARLVVPS